jgi:glycosyltransferase involved in cell wall biosynthesis
LSWESQLSVVIPAFNEETGLRATLEELRTRLPLAELLVIDDGSTDGTAAVARAVDGVVLIQHPFNRGYGAALKTGMRNATRALVAWFDADHEHRVDDLVAMAERLVDQRLAAVIGRRTRPGSSVLRSTGKWVIRRLVHSLGSTIGSDLNCGLRIFRREIILPYLSLLPDTFSASLTSTMVLIERRYPFVFHEIELRSRMGQSKVRLADGFTTMVIVIRMVTLFAPLRVFLRLGIGLTLIGGLYGGVIAYLNGQGLPTAALLLMLAGIIVAVLGLIADQISQLRLSPIVAAADEAHDRERRG